MLEGRILVSGIMVLVFATAVLLSFTYAPEARFLPLVIGIPGLILSVAQPIFLGTGALVYGNCRGPCDMGDSVRRI